MNSFYQTVNQCLIDKKLLPWFSEYIFKCNICSIFWSQMSLHLIFGKFRNWKIEVLRKSRTYWFQWSIINFFVVWIVQYHLHRCQTRLWSVYWIIPKLKIHEIPWIRVTQNHVTPSVFETYQWKTGLFKMAFETALETDLETDSKILDQLGPMGPRKWRSVNPWFVEAGNS